MSVIVVTQDAQGPYGCLANFYRTATPIMWEGKAYATAEHLYHARKFIFPGAPPRFLQYAEEIRKASTPWKAKILGQHSHLTRYPWQRALSVIINRYPDVRVDAQELDERRLGIMADCIRCKILQDPHSRSVLLSTGTAPIIKAGHPFWGADPWGNCANMIGEILMAVRSELQRQ